MSSQCELAHQRNRFRNCNRLRPTRLFTFPGGDHQDVHTPWLVGQHKGIGAVSRGSSCPGITLAVDVTEQGHGVGKGLLKDALLRTLQAVDIGGLRAVIVHAKDAQAKAFFCEKFGFEPSPLDESHRMLLLKDVRRTVMGSN